MLSIRNRQQAVSCMLFTQCLRIPSTWIKKEIIPHLFVFSEFYVLN